MAASRRVRLITSLLKSSCWRQGGYLSVMLSLLFLGALLLAACPSGALGFRADEAPLRIDCGSSEDSTIDGHEWVADRGYDSGRAAEISSAQAEAHSLSRVEATLRAFDFGTTGCYKIKRKEGRYLVRVGLGYFDFDGQKTPPVFNITIQGVPVSTVDMGAIERQPGNGTYYSDYIVPTRRKRIAVCFGPANLTGVAEKTLSSLDYPLVNSLEILPFDTEAYEVHHTGRDAILSNHIRINFGGPAIHAEPEDPGFRTWAADPGRPGTYTALLQGLVITHAEMAPEYLPMAVFRSARAVMTPETMTGVQYEMVPVDPGNSFLALFYFAEIQSLTGQGERLFRVLIGGGGQLRALKVGGMAEVDLLRIGPILDAVIVPSILNFTNASANAAYSLEFAVQTAEDSSKPAIINGLELYEIIPIAPEPKPDELSPWAIFGITVACVVGFALLVAGGYWGYNKWSSSQNAQRFSRI